MKKSIYLRTIFCLGTILLVTAFYSCKVTQQQADMKDLSYLYNPTRNAINPRYEVVNQSDESSDIYIKFFANELFFSEANPQGVPTAMMLISVKLFNINQGKALADTAVSDLRIVKEANKTEYVYSLPLKVDKGIQYMAEVKILDRLRIIVVQAFVPFNTMSVYNKYNFEAVGHFNKNLLFNPVLRVNEYVNLLYTRGHVDSLFVSYYKPFTQVPDPPSMLLPEKTLDYPPDKVIALPYSDTLPMMFPRDGIYMCSVSRKENDGFTFLNLGPHFPSMTTPEAMIEPLAYLATPDELDSMRSAPRPKAALDDFWIKCGGNIDKSRELIRIYYTRVLYANYYFTSYKDGWRTERGMIYIMYGPPDKVYKTSEGEIWAYKKASVKSSWGDRYTVKEDYLKFTFKKKDNILTDNDFFLSRGESPVTYWDKAVASWKKGLVYRLDNPEGL